MQRSEDLGLLVADEEDHETLLLHRISADDIYRKQEGILQLHSFVSFLPVYNFCYVSVQFMRKHILLFRYNYILEGFGVFN